MGYLDEEKYKLELWHHKPLTDFWQIGEGTERRLNKMRLFDMYDVAHADHKKLFKEFGINAEYLIDHAWGREYCTSLFSNQQKLDKERKLELTINNLKDKMGKNIILRGTNFLQESTARARNTMIGGHNRWVE